MKPTREIYPDGRTYYSLNGLCHRKNEPAVITPEGSVYWYKNGKLHREDGPAVIDIDGSLGWFLNGERVKNETRQNDI